MSINAPFKKHLHNQYIDFPNDNENKRNPIEIYIINAVVDLRYDVNKITNESIIKSLKVTGISVNLDESEDNLIIHHHEIYDEIISPLDVNISDKDFKKIKEYVESEKKLKQNSVDDIQTKITSFFSINEEESMDLDD